MNPKDLNQIESFLISFQSRVCNALEIVDAKARFQETSWEHVEKGGGISKLLLDGSHLEKAGVNFSHIKGTALPPAATLRHPELINTPFAALGVSIVIHPVNPYVPTTHANIRFLSAENGAWWFGGGFDLTPYYGFIEDCQYWHQMAKETCDPFGVNVYSQFKSNCDDYFYLKHRKEPRGIGGLFFDDLNVWGFARSFEFIEKVSETFLTSYQTILNRRKQMPFGEKEKAFQLYRRGRYVEFNLLYDRGTLFGLQAGGRVDSILMSLPPLVSWSACHKEDEARLLNEFLNRKEWV